MYRWICSQHSRLHDPSLMRTVQELMKKLLLNLVCELKRLGANVVYADTSTILLATGKHGMRDALGYADYILDTLRKRELFQWLSLSPIKAWHTLLFYDRFNYLGLKAPLPAEMAAMMSQNPGSLTSGGSQLMDSVELEVTTDILRRPIFDLSLTIRDYLPEALSDIFTTMIGEYVWLPWKESVQEVLEDSEGQGSTKILQDLLAKQNDWMSKYLPAKMTEKLLKATKNISLRIGSHDGNESHSFPVRAGSHLKPSELGTPALAFVKAVCQLYGLDKYQKDAVTMLRRQLLKMIHVKEFGPEAAWKDPCASLVIPNVVCSSCQDCQDLDMCRDPTLQAGDVVCHMCGAPRDMDALEMRLVSSLHELVESFLVQDLKCKKCGTTSTEHLQRQCDCCGGPLVASKPAPEVRTRLDIYGNVAHVQGMETLEAFVQQLTDGFEA